MDHQQEVTSVSSSAPRSTLEKSTQPSPIAHAFRGLLPSTNTMAGESSRLPNTFLHHHPCPIGGLGRIFTQQCCPFCPFLSRNGSQMREHLWGHCGRMIPQLISLESHSDGQICPLCPLLTRNSLELRTHMWEHRPRMLRQFESYLAADESASVVEQDSTEGESAGQQRRPYLRYRSVNSFGGPLA